MIYDWYKIFNLTAFNALDLVSRTYSFNLADIGIREVMVTKGDTVGVLYEGIFLSIGLNDKNPFEFDLHAVYLDANNDVWLGVNGREEDSDDAS